MAYYWQTQIRKGTQMSETTNPRPGDEPKDEPPTTPPPTDDKGDEGKDEEPATPGSPA
jgi:hypothetical protein